ncbi:hypothetical protein BDZ88DRAFT_402324 [Geranomyces variabilis]|nr:hypothetical protein BDZ88DRAFT_402324 [Geranomyces variabilis]KAJ3142901.1 hypothetical protein HDU90_002773 [Geranomyces variabilis]
MPSIPDVNARHIVGWLWDDIVLTVNVALWLKLALICKSFKHAVYGPLRRSLMLTQATVGLSRLREHSPCDKHAIAAAVRLLKNPLVQLDDIILDLLASSRTRTAARFLVEHADACCGNMVQGHFVATDSKGSVYMSDCGRWLHGRQHQLHAFMMKDVFVVRKRFGDSHFLYVALTGKPHRSSRSEKCPFVIITFDHMESLKIYALPTPWIDDAGTGEVVEWSCGEIVNVEGRPNHFSSDSSSESDVSF